MLTVEDIKLNTTVFHWPETIKTVFELSHTRILNRRDQVEDDVRKRVSAFEEKLNEYQKEIDSFKKKEVRKTLICAQIFKFDKF
jgi:dynein heavy chain